MTNGPISVYIAAPYQTRAEAIRVMVRLEVEGFEVTSRWLRAPDTLSDADARKDLEDVARADVVLAMNAPEWATQGTGGRHVEFGYAVALGIPIVLLGVRSNIFHHLSQVMLAESIDSLPAHLRWAVQTFTGHSAVISTANSVNAVIGEYRRAAAKHPPMASPHEAYAVILEELDELWAEIKRDDGRSQGALIEAVQVAAMGLRYVTDLAPAPGSLVVAGRR